MGTLRFDRVTLDYSDRRRQADGSLVVRGRFARTGCQSYLNDDGSERVEFRSPDVVRASAASFEGVAVTDTHPAGMVSSDNWQALSRGHVQGVSFVADGPDGEGWLEADFHIKAASLIDAIERGERPELSAGYFCDSVEEPGDYRGQRYHCRQADVIGNHVASIPEGTARAGRGARLLLDSHGDQLPPGHRSDGEKERPMNEFEVVIGTVPYKVAADATARQALTGHLAMAQGLQTAVDTQRVRADAAEAKHADAVKERDALKARLDAAEQKLAETKSQLADATDPAKLSAAVKARAELVERARRLGGPSISTDGSDQELKVRALEAAGVKLTEQMKASPAYIDARLDAAVERLQELEDHGELTIHDALGGDRVVRASDRSDDADPFDVFDAARDRYLAAREED